MDATTLDIVNEERKELVREIVTSVLAQVIPEARQAVGADFVDQITGIVNKRFDELDTATETRHNEFVKQTEARFAQTATKEELAGVTKAGAENTERLTKLEASTEARLKLLEEENKTLKANDKLRSDEIKKIEASANKTAENAEKTSRAVIDLIAEFKAEKAETAREIGAIKDAQKQDEKALRTAQEDILGTRSEVNDMKTTLATETGSARTQVKLLTDKVADVQAEQKAQEVRQDRAEERLNEYGTLYRAFRWLETHPRIGGALLGAFFFSQGAALFLMYVIARNGILTPR